MNLVFIVVLDEFSEKYWLLLYCLDENVFENCKKPLALGSLNWEVVTRVLAG